MSAQVRIQKPKPPVTKGRPELDTRTPSGKKLPY
jgi:hypothetical protein